MTDDDLQINTGLRPCECGETALWDMESRMDTFIDGSPFILALVQCRRCLRGSRLPYYSRAESHAAWNAGEAFAHRKPFIE
jgi:hypothetical protein